MFPHKRSAVFHIKEFSRTLFETKDQEGSTFKMSFHGERGNEDTIFEKSSSSPGSDCESSSYKSIEHVPLTMNAVTSDPRYNIRHL